MFKNAVKVTLRNMKRQKGYSLINIFGLAVGMACCILILLWVQDELSYDKYHEKADQIHRVIVKGRMSNREINFSSSPAPLASTLVNEFPEVLEATRFLRSKNVLVRYQDKFFNEDLILFADSNFFDVFSIPLLKGDPDAVLGLPNSVVITRTAALKYFGEENPIGKTLTMNNRMDYRITGLAENVPSNTHFHTDFFASLETIPDSKSPNWFSNPYHTYIVLKEGTSPEELQAKLPGIVTKYVGPQAQKIMGITLEQFQASGNTFGYFLQPITSIHLYSDLEYELEPNGSVTYVYIFSVIAFFILVIACINFMNLATARSANRAKEVGVRKVLGSNRSRLVKQFLIESLLLSFISLVFAVLIVELLQPVFNNLSGKQLNISLHGNWILLPGFIAVMLFVGVLAGSYPAFFLSSFQPISVLRGKLIAGMKSTWLRNGLVIFQFTVSIVLLVGTFVIYRQLEYTRNKKLGFEKEQVLVIQRAHNLSQQKEAFRNELLKHPNVVNVAYSNSVPGRHFGDWTHRAEGAPANEMVRMFLLLADFDYLDTLQMEMISGRYFSQERPADQNSVIINETAAKALGLEDPVGKRLVRGSLTPGKDEIFTIIGVVKDFHFESLHREIRPLAMYLLSNEEVRYISIRTDPEAITQTLAFLENKWKAFVPGQPFEYFFLDDDFDSLYKAEKKIGQLFTSFSILAILVACLGLFGLASFTAEQRTKEIGIRKVLGATVSNVIVLLTKEFSKWVLLANIIAWPVAYFAMHRWLQSFVYRINIGVWMFFLAALLALAIALVTVSYQAVRAALANPAESLRYE
jgi:putative ABC transport system permease protein